MISILFYVACGVALKVLVPMPFIDDLVRKGYATARDRVVRWTRYG